MMMTKKAGALVMICMIGLATCMPCVMARSSRKCSPPPPGIPGLAPGTGTCPLNALKLGACVDALGGVAHVGVGDPIVNKCCPVLKGVLELEAALCLCTTIRVKILNLNIILPLALELFVQCGLTPPPGFKCPPLN
ncbi:hypothetical protein SUGI_0491990 [Cryptomeria japonica]|uniref:36.4 kDa proline-rich protein-like n=1 Tax=Cryptomeria japonica TaxID=3369 RepID=UPI002408C481|nr:36.4 kDa proline-rich protein-like [Cryptomeria japonica]GLJ25679.1 hypothetical protein SUGI_0491990 [Cryptomeria japonica]